MGECIRRTPEMHYNVTTEGMTTCLQQNRTTGPYATPLVKHPVYTPPCETAFEQAETKGTSVTAEGGEASHTMYGRY